MQRELTETSIEFKFVSISKNKGQTCKLHLQFHVFFIELTPELHQKHVINIFYDCFFRFLNYCKKNKGWVDVKGKEGVSDILSTLKRLRLVQNTGNWLL